jgi:type VI protein secretion system component VasK
MLQRAGLVRGRRCLATTFWSSKDAICLEIGGRGEDLPGWMAGLGDQGLVRGAIIVVDLDEILDADWDIVDTLARSMRARLDDMTRAMSVPPPVHIVFTKLDRFEGFQELYDDGGWVDRTRRLSVLLGPADRFDALFDALLDRVREEALTRMAGVKSDSARQRIVQFPLEIAWAKRNVERFIAQLLGETLFQTPILRSFHLATATRDEPVFAGLARAIWSDIVADRRAPPPRPHAVRRIAAWASRL